MGKGGAQFLDTAGTGIGLADGSETSGRQAENPEGNASAPFYAGPVPVSSEDVLTLYDADQPTVIANLPQAKAGTRRLAQLAKVARSRSQLRMSAGRSGVLLVALPP